MQGRYKSIEVNQESLANLVRYVHLHPQLAKLASSPKEYQWSSYKKYLREESMVSCDTSLILDTFGTLDKFTQFHSDMEDYIRSLDTIKNIVIE